VWSKNGMNEPNTLTLKAIKSAFEAAGLLFIDADERRASV
jgi:hypothetical protein